jgi:hypothetical protein
MTMKRVGHGTRALLLGMSLGLALVGSAAAAPPAPGGKMGRIITNVQTRITIEQRSITTALAPVQEKAAHALGLTP